MLRPPDLVEMRFGDTWIRIEAPGKTLKLSAGSAGHETVSVLAADNSQEDWHWALDYTLGQATSCGDSDLQPRIYVPVEVRNGPYATTWTSQLWLFDLWAGAGAGPPAIVGPIEVAGSRAVDGFRTQVWGAQLYLTRVGCEVEYLAATADLNHATTAVSEGRASMWDLTQGDARTCALSEFGALDGRESRKADLWTIYRCHRLAVPAPADWAAAQVAPPEGCKIERMVGFHHDIEWHPAFDDLRGVALDPECVWSPASGP